MRHRLRSSFASFLKQLDYRGLAAAGTRPRSAVERYLLVRAHIILGDYARAETCLRELPEEFGARFLAIQLRIFRRLELPRCHFDLYALLGQVPNDDYWLGEYHLIAGYLSQLLDEYTQASRHQQLAADHYRAADLAGCEAIALYNLTVCHDHLNEREKLDRAHRRLEAIASHCEIPVVTLFWRRVRANLALDLEEYAAAADDLEHAAELCRLAGRWRDLGSITCTLSYLHLKLGQALPIELNEKHFLPEHVAILKEWRELARRALVLGTDAARTLRRWRKLGLDSVFYFLLADALLERVTRAQEYEWVLRTAHQLGQSTLRRQQALALVDFRHYEILCLIKLGRHARATTIWNSYHQDAREGGSDERLRRARELAPLLRETESVAVESEGGTLDTGLHQLVWHGRRIDLRGKPLIEKFLARLASTGSLTLSSIYDALYGGEYEPLLHGRRLHSLIDRTRRLLGEARAVQRRDGRLSLAGHVRVAHTRVAAPSGEARRERLLARIHQSSAPIGLGDIASGLEWSRRTLQLDLNALLKVGAIRARGRTRKRLYYVER